MTPEQVQLFERALPVIGTLLGAAFGAAGGAVATWVQVRGETKRQTQRLALELGFQEWKAYVEQATQAGAPALVYPPITFIHTYLELLKLVDAGSVTPEALKAVLRRSSAVGDVFDEFTRTEQARDRSRDERP